MKEYNISDNIKSDFCEFTSNRISGFFKEFDEKVQEIKEKLNESISSQLIQYLSKVDSFDFEF
jgi:hypothetical protein